MGKAMHEGKRKGKGNGKGKGVDQQTPGGDNIFCPIELQLQKEIYQAGSVTKGYLEEVFLAPEALPAEAFF
jgi:hypothetical protein